MAKSQRAKLELAGAKVEEHETPLRMTNPFVLSQALTKRTVETRIHARNTRTNRS